MGKRLHIAENEAILETMPTQLETNGCRVHGAEDLKVCHADRICRNVTVSLPITPMALAAMQHYINVGRLI